eukprot:TRINITY_DN1491_c0_g1_i2.p1 TRINITY_DN1491_c0_g1~~TRINITY_DN1491_c0_g1_i2.p1  ORF type:complete len:182 (+),score=18.55 TRINITY_DN1491_c0_g1_i2:244-789(+)
MLPLSNRRDNNPVPYQQMQEEGAIAKAFDIKQASHPCTCLTTSLFKLSVVVCYFVLSLVLERLYCLIITVVISAFDFWFVKNIAGRYLIGMRWWSEIQPDGRDFWVFECRLNEDHVNPVDKNFFWWSQIIATLIWLVTTVIRVISFEFFEGGITGFVFVLNAVNLIAYYNCSKGKGYGNFG